MTQNIHRLQYIFLKPCHFGFKYVESLWSFCWFYELGAVAFIHFTNYSLGKHAEMWWHSQVVQCKVSSGGQCDHPSHVCQAICTTLNTLLHLLHLKWRVLTISQAPCRGGQGTNSFQDINIWNIEYLTNTLCTNFWVFSC